LKNIYDVLKAKEAEYSSLITEHRMLGDRVQKLAREIDAVRLTVKLLGDAQETKDESSTNLSQPQMLRAVLAENKREMHLSEILAGVEARFNKKLNPNVTAAVIFRYAKRKSIFYKSEDKPNTWGLLTFRGQGIEPKSILEIVEKAGA
jgi:hypothetical protein